MSLMRTSVALALAAMLAAGCSLFHSETPQQRFIEAVSHGNSAQAGSIWLHMSPQDRMAFEHGQGMSPRVSRAEVRKEVLQKAQAQAAQDQNQIQNPDLNPAPSAAESGGLPGLFRYAPPSGNPAGPPSD